MKKLSASELRIGNICTVTRNYEGTIERPLECNDIYMFSLESYLIEPIPLTEDWLLKFGFIKDGSNYVKLIIEEYCNLFFDLKHKTIAIGVEYEAGGTEFSFEYIHQLQNLYFALNGNELKLI